MASRVRTQQPHSAFPDRANVVGVWDRRSLACGRGRLGSRHSDSWSGSSTSLPEQEWRFSLRKHRCLDCVANNTGCNAGRHWKEMVEQLNSPRPVQSALRVEDFSVAHICLIGSIGLLLPVLVNYPTYGAYKNWPNQWSRSTCSNAYNCLRQQ
jgi:hypothetical protein